MQFTNTQLTLTKTVQRVALQTISVACFSLAFPLAACSGSQTDAEGRRLPSDDQVIADVTPSDTADVVSVETTAGKTGETYLHKNDLAWYFDRGVIVKRKAAIEGVPDAVVVVGGLARYVWSGERYDYLRFITTYNEYEGIPAPSEKELVEYVEAHLADVFASRDHTIVKIDAVSVEDQPWQWHSATSFTVPFRISYEHITNNTTVEAREDVVDLRFYRDAVAGPIQNLLASERSREVLGKRQHDAAEIRSMPTLRSGLR